MVFGGVRCTGVRQRIPKPKIRVSTLNLPSMCCAYAYHMHCLLCGSVCCVGLCVCMCMCWRLRVCVPACERACAYVSAERLNEAPSISSVAFACAPSPNRALEDICHQRSLLFCHGSLAGVRGGGDEDEGGRKIGRESGEKEGDSGEEGRWRKGGGGGGGALPKVCHCCQAPAL